MMTIPRVTCVDDNCMEDGRVKEEESLPRLNRRGVFRRSAA